MGIYTISTHGGHAVSQGHNRRDRAITDYEENIDPRGHFEIWTDEPLADAYHRLFDEPQAEYNARTRASRQITGAYLDTVAADRHKHPVYEMILTIGNKDTPPPPEQAREILRQAVQGWQKRNPALVMIGAYYHADEPGVPHVHVDYIPVMHSNRGMALQSSLSGALREMGYVTAKGKGTAQMQWQAAENQALEQACRAVGWDVIHPQAGKAVAHAGTRAYKEAAEQTAKQAAHDAEVAVGRARVQGLEVLSKAYKEAHAVEDAAEEQAEQIVQDAQKAADAILSQADRELQAAKRKAAEIKAQAEQDAAEAAQKAAERILSQKNTELQALKGKAAEIAAQMDEKQSYLASLQSKAIKDIQSARDSREAAQLAKDAEKQIENAGFDEIFAGVSGLNRAIEEYSQDDGGWEAGDWAGQAQDCDEQAERHPAVEDWEFDL